jgi:hypothetical protein
MLEQIQQRVMELTKALEESVQKHNALVGAFEEAKKIYEMAAAAKAALDQANTETPQ